MAVLQQPVVLDKRACIPLAVLQQPTVLEQRVSAPIAVLPPPRVLVQRAEAPMAVFRAPDVFATRALHPSAVRAAVVQPLTIPATVGVALGRAPQQIPLVAVEQANRAWPSVPTVNVVGVLAAVPVIRSPLAVMQEQGIPLPPPATHSRAFEPVELRT